MSKSLALDWLKSSYSDIVTLNKISDDDFITHVTAFHSQQSTEKCLKAILEYNDTKVPSKHDLRMLNRLVSNYITIDDDLILDSLNTLYIDSRYPGDMGLLPHGKPTLEQAQEFYEFAKHIFYRVCKLLEIDPEEVKK